MTPKIFLPAALVLAVVVFGCQKSSAPRYLITGSSTCQPVIAAAAASLEQLDPAVKYQVETGGSGRGISDARSGKAAAGMSSRDLKSEEQQGLQVVPFARDGVAMIVHKERNLDALDSATIRAIYTGKITNWKDLGGVDAEIKVVNKAEGRATLEVFLAKFGLKNSEIEADVVVGDNAQCVRLVAAEPFAIGYLSIGEALRAIDRGEPLQLLRLDGIEASLQTVQDGSFPLGRTLYLLFPEVVDPQGQRIVDYLRSPAGNELLLSQGFVPLSGS